jgi:hypothetical protein
MQEIHSKKQNDEIQLLGDIAERSKEPAGINQQYALALARAAHDTLIAKEKLAKSCVTECLRLLDTLHDAVDATHFQVKEVNSQLGSVLNIVDQLGISIDPSESTHLISPQLPSPSSSSEFDSMSSWNEEMDEVSSCSDAASDL